MLRVCCVLRIQSAEYAQMLRDAVANGEAPPLCATAKLGEPGGGCADSVAADAEFARTRGLDADRGFITGPTTSIEDAAARSGL